MNLVTLAQAKMQVNQVSAHDDAKLESIRAQASAIIFMYLKLDVDDTGFDWLDAFGEPTDRVPMIVTAATLTTIAAMYENSDGTENAQRPQVLSKSVTDMLSMLRMPTLA